MGRQVYILPKGFLTDALGQEWGPCAVDPKSVIIVRDGTRYVQIPALSDAPRQPPEPNQIAKPAPPPVTIWLAPLDGVMMAEHDRMIYVWESHLEFMGVGVMKTVGPDGREIIDGRQ